MPTFFASSKTVPLTGLTNAHWNTVDISSYVPANTVAVMCSTHNSVGWTHYVIARGTTDPNNYATSLYDGAGNHYYTNGVICSQVHGGNSIDIYFNGGNTLAFLSIYGYFTSDEMKLPTAFGNVVTP